MENIVKRSFAIVVILMISMVVTPGCRGKKKGLGAGPGQQGYSGSGLESEDIPGRTLTPEEEQRRARDNTFTEPPQGALVDVYFEYDRSDLSDEARMALESNAAWINANPSLNVQVEGHCDERGTEEYNLALGERRATSVKNYLVSLGVDNRRLFTLSYGEELPIDDGHNEAAWAKNRRAHLLTTP